LDELFPALESRGATPEAIARIHAPIGLNIGSKTPFEIAISICAELIAVRRGRMDESPT
jgi:xanthine dehydrogenase accessory factor